jgi:hypothetical protein
MKRWLIPVVAVVVIAVGVGGFFGGRAGGGAAPTPAEAMKVLQNLTDAQRQALAQSGGTGTQTGAPSMAGGPSGNMTSGSIVSCDANSMVVKLSDGSTKLVIFSGSTAISVSKTGSSTDLTAGQEVRVSGTTNSDGSITATSIQCGTAGAGAPPAGGTTGTTAAAGARTNSGTATSSGTGTSASAGANSGAATGSSTATSSATGSSAQ